MGKRVLVIVFGIAVLAILFFVAFIPLANDFYARQVKEELLGTPLPENTEIIDSVSRAGKLVGNGNGIQYFGAILLKSDLSLQELEDYYADFRENEWSYVVERQKDQSVEVIEHGSVRFSKKAEENGCYIVYSWGDGPNLLEELDLRGR